MEATELLRVVALKKGKLKVSEFLLRKGERGLSVFTRAASPSPQEVLDAVRAAGKQGELAAAILSLAAVRELGLKVVRTHGGTPSEAVNALHAEARLPWWRALLIRLRGRSPREYFNERLSERLCTSARLLE